MTGLLLVGQREAQEEPVPDQFHMKIGVKLLGLTVLNIGVAVFWNLV